MPTPDSENDPYTVTPCQQGSPTYRVKRYRDRAEALRRIAEDVSGEHRNALMQLAASYDRMAADAEAGARPPV